MVKSKKDLSADVADVVALYEYSHDEWEESEQDSLECYRFMLNEQWTDEEKEYLAKDDRAPMVYNMLLPRINNLIGTEQLNRKSIKITPFRQEHRQMASTINDMVWNNWQTQEFELYLQKAFADGLISKKGGWIKIYVKYDENMMPIYSLRNPDPFSVYPDPDYKDYKMTDCRWIIEERWLTLDEIIDTYGDRDDYAVEKQVNTYRSLLDKVSGMFKPDDLGDYYNKDSGKYKVLELQERKTRKSSILLNVSTGEKILVLPDEVNDLVSDGSHVFVADTKSKYIHLKTVFPYFNLMLLDEPHALNADMFDIINYYSIDFNNRKSHNSSLVYALLDPQKNMNKREIQKTWMLDHTVNSPVFFGMEDKETRDEYERKGNKPGLGFLFRSLRTPPFRLPAPNIPNGAWTDIQDSEAKMNDISSINNAMRGQSDYSNESALLMQTKLSRVAASVNPYFNNLSITRKMVGEYILKTIKQVYGQTDRVVNTMDRVGKTDQTVINSSDMFGEITDNNINNFEGIVVLDEAEYSPTKRTESFQTKLALVQIMGMQFIKPEWLLKDSDLSDVDEQIEYMNQMLGIQADQMAQQQAMQEQSAVLEQLKAEKELATPPTGGTNGSKK